MEVAILILTGLGVGFISSFFGVGGGILTVPMLYMLFPKLPPQTVIASSLAVIFVNSLLNTRNFVKAGKKPIKQFSIIIAVSMMLGAITGGRLALILDGNLIKMIFAVVVFGVALKTILSKLKQGKIDNWGSDLSTNFLIISGLTSFAGGVISGLTGLGGGAVIVPLFITLLNMPFSWAPVYSNIAMGMGTLAGVVTYMLAAKPVGAFAGSFIENFQVGHVNWAVALIIFFGALFSSKIGVKANEKVDPKLAKNLFAALLFIISIRIFIKALF